MPYQYLNSIHFVEYLASRDIHDNFIKNLGINTDGIIGNDNEEQKLKLITTRYTEKKLSNTKSLPDLASLNEGKIILDKYLLSQEIKVNQKNHSLKSNKKFKI